MICPDCKKEFKNLNKHVFCPGKNIFEKSKSSIISGLTFEELKRHVNNYLNHVRNPKLLLSYQVSNHITIREDYYVLIELPFIRTFKNEYKIENINIITEEM